MRLGGRIQAAAEVLEDIAQRRTPVTMALRDWGKSHRFAGSKDRSAIGNIVLDSLRKKNSIAFRMNDDSPRALALGAVVFSGGVSVEDIIEQTEGDKHFGAPLTEDQIAKLKGQIKLEDAPDHIRADVPDWLWPAFETNFDEEAATTVFDAYSLCEAKNYKSALSGSRIILLVLSLFMRLPSGQSPVVI